MDNLKLDLTLALDLIAYAIGQAKQKFDKPVCVAVCDAYGFLIGLGRADGAPVRSIALAQQKAYTSTRMGSTTTAFLGRLRNEDIPIGFFCDPLLTALPGGALLADAAGRVLGAIGISGLSPVEDQGLADDSAGFITQYHDPHGTS
jgi:uncharacterized protein GlcG (DUF336 family)